MSEKKKVKEKKVVDTEDVEHVTVMLPNGTMRNVKVTKGSAKVEIFKIHEDFKVEKFKNRKDYEDNKPYDTVDFQDNVMLNEGANLLWTLICGGAGFYFSGGSARVGVGDSNSAEDPTQGGLLGGNQLYKGMDATYPQYGSARQAVFRGTYTELEANWHWLEYTIDNGDLGLVNINRKVQDQGVKPEGEIWRLRITLRF